MEWMLLPYRRLYAAIAGRSSRREFWMFTLLNVLILVAYVALFLFFGGIALFNPATMSAKMASGGIIVLIILMLPLYAWVLISWPASLAVTIRRFHDLNLSGWIYAILLVAGFIPLVNLVVALALLIMMCVKGTDGPNKYGEDPTQIAYQGDAHSVGKIFN